MNSKTTKQKAQPQTGRPLTVPEALGAAHRALANGQLQQAEVICLQLLQASPENAEALHILGLIAHRVGKLDVAINLLQRAVKSNDTVATYQSNLCEMLRQARRPDLAEPHGRRAVELDPKSPGALNNLAIALQEQEKLEESLPFFKRALKQNPRFAECHSNLGNTYKKMRKNPEALEEYRAALAINPRYPEALSNMAVVMSSMGDYQKALELAEQAVRLNPRYAEGFNNLAIALNALEQWDKSLIASEKSIALRPDYAEAYASLANTLKEMGRLNAALNTVEKAVSLKRNGEILGVYGLVLHHLGRGEEAEKIYREAVELDPKRAESRNGWAHALTELRRNDEAIEQFHKAAELDADTAPSYYFNLAFAKKFKAGDEDIARMEAMLAKLSDGPRRNEHASQLNYALGKAWQDLGDYERAWNHFSAGAKLKRSTISDASIATTEKLFGRIMEVFNEESIKKLEGLGDSSAQPIFIIGMPRSGTSLVEQILASHPDVFGAGELPDISVVSASIIGSDNRSFPFPEYLPVLDEKALKQMGATYLQRVNARIPEAKRFTDKMPANFFFLGLIHLMFPNARVIHCKRNPLDNCVSLFTTLFTAHQDFSYDLTDLGRFYKHYEELMAHWRKVLPEGSFLDVVYEDTVEDLESQARRILEFCGLPWDDACLAFHETKRAVRTASIQQVRQPIYKTSVERWRRYETHLAPLQQAING